MILKKSLWACLHNRPISVVCVRTVVLTTFNTEIVSEKFVSLVKIGFRYIFTEENSDVQVIT